MANPNDLTKLNKTEKQALQNATTKEKLQLEGICNSKKLEHVPRLKEAEQSSETLFSGQNNAEIAFGRDRPSELCSGYGGSGDTHCGRIDIVVGRHPNQEDPEKEVNPNFKKDAARIYISQRTDIDKNFKLTKGRVGNSVARSAIGIKADAVRIIGREGIKLVTRVDRRNSVPDGTGEITTIKGIDLIAGNKSGDLQPLAKGKNLNEILNIISNDLELIVGMVNSLATKQLALDSALAAHTHSVIPDPTSPTLLGTLPSLTAATACAIDAAQLGFLDFPSHFNRNISIISHRQEYLKKGGSKFILSSYNNTN
jgi:hypothetical protein